MPSSPNITDIPTAEQLIEGLHRRLKQASKNITNERLKTGEYVRCGDKIVARVDLEEEPTVAESPVVKAEDVLTVTYGGQDLVASRVDKSRFNRRRPRIHLDSRKSPTAESVEAFIHPQAIHVKAAAPILRQDGADGMLQDGQLYAYDSKSQELIPLKGNFAGQVRKSRPRSAKLRLEQKAPIFKSK